MRYHWEAQERSISDLIRSSKGGTPTRYVSVDWISLAKVGAPVEVKLQEGTVTAGLNVRKSPVGAKVGALNYGTKVKILEQSGV